MSWSLISSSDTSNRIYSRPLSTCESTYYFQRLLQGTGDLLWQVFLQQHDRAEGAEIFSEENVSRAWATVKQWYPLLAARLDDSDGVDTLKFVVSERDLSRHSPSEVIFVNVSSGTEVDGVIESFLRDPPTEYKHLLAQIFVFFPQDTTGAYQVVFRMSHMITDGVSGPIIARTLFDVLTAPPDFIPTLEDRLNVALSYDQLNPTLKLSPARQRWRRAAARVVFLNRRRKLAGGQTIPWTATKESYRTPGITSHVDHWFSRADSVAIFNACKKNAVTIGTVIPVISQLAITRMLYRRYLRGEMTEDEWEHRRRQPMHYTGPTNLRPHLDKEWQRKGGADAVVLSIDFYECTLPFMPTPYGVRRDEGVPRLPDGAPPFSALMSPARFFHRARMFKMQLQRILKSPLMLDIALARHPSRLLNGKRSAVHWLAESRGEPLPPMDMPPYWDSAPADYVPSTNLSSLGQLTSVLPYNYPLPSGHPLSVSTPRASDPGLAATKVRLDTQSRVYAPPSTLPEDALLRIVHINSFVHGAPLEFFLGTGTEGGRLAMVGSFDMNGYTKADVEEFLLECRDAALYYLDGESSSESRNVEVRL